MVILLVIYLAHVGTIPVSAAWTVGAVSVVETAASRNISTPAERRNEY